MTDLIQRPRRLRKSPALRAMFEETTLSLNDLVLPIFVEDAKLNASPTPVFVP